MSKKSKQWQSLPKTPAGWAGFVVVAAGVLVLAIWLCWRAMLQVPADTARVWAIVATLLIPIAAYTAWRLGLIEARSRLAGIDQAVNKVMDVSNPPLEGVGLREMPASPADQPQPPAIRLMGLRSLRIHRHFGMMPSPKHCGPRLNIAEGRRSVLADKPL